MEENAYSFIACDKKTIELPAKGRDTECLHKKCCKKFKKKGKKQCKSCPKL